MENTEKTLDELGAAVREGEQLLHNTPVDGSERTRQLRAKLQATLDKAKAMYE